MDVTLPNAAKSLLHFPHRPPHMPGDVPRTSLLANALYGAAFAYYHYLTFLGYNALPFLDRAELFLFPIAALMLATPISTLVGFNPARFVLGVYFG